MHSDDEKLPQNMWSDTTYIATNTGCFIRTLVAGNNVEKNKNIYENATI